MQRAFIHCKLRSRVFHFFARRDAALKQSLFALRCEARIFKVRPRLRFRGLGLAHLVHERLALELGEQLSCFYGVALGN